MARPRFFVHLTRSRSWKYRFAFAPPCSFEPRSSSSSSSVGSVPGSCDETRNMQHREKSCSPRLDKTSSQHMGFGQKGTSEAIWMNSHGKPSLGDSRVKILHAQLQHSGTEGETGLPAPGHGFGSLCEWGRVDEALDTLRHLEEQGTSPSVQMYTSLLKACSKRKILRQAKRVQACLEERGLDRTRFLGELMVSTLVKCGGLEDALQVFYGLPERTVFSWTAVISGFAKSGKARDALRMYKRMRQEGVQPNAYTFVSLLKACGSIGDLVEGKRIHAEAVKQKCEDDSFLQTCLVDMYGKCGSIVEAQSVFSGLSQRDVVSWTAMLSAYTQQGHPEMALRLYEQMREEGVSPNDHTFASTLQACGMLAEKEEATAAADGRFVKIKSLERGKAIHAHAQKKGYDSDFFVASTLVSMYGKCGSILAARTVFDGLSQTNVVIWNVMLVAYAEQEQADAALQLYEQMRQEGISPNDRTFVTALQVCGMVADNEDYVMVDVSSSKIKSLLKGKALHAEARRLGYHSDVFVGNSLISLYGKCGSITDAQSVFDRLSLCDVVGWTSMVTAYVEHSQGEKALQLFEKMREEGPSPDIHAFLSVFRACIMLAEQEEGVLVDGLCTKLSSLKKSKILHVDARRKGYVPDVFIGNTLICLYGKCGSTVDACTVFDSLSQRTAVSWNVMLAAYVDNGEAEKALQLYHQMLEEGVSSDVWSFVSTIQACGMLAEKEDDVILSGQYTKVKCLEQGKVVHADARKRGYNSDLFVGSSLISFYGKCGSPADAWEVFDQLPHQDVVSWTSILAAYVEQSEPGKALQLYGKMREMGVSPNDRTIVSALQACGMFAAEEDVVDGRSLRVKSLEMVKAMHFDAQTHGYGSDVLVGSTLISLYGKCGSILDAQGVFEGLSQCDVVALTAMVTTYNEQEHAEKALQVYRQMREEGVSPDVHMLVSVLRACGKVAEKEDGVIVDDRFIKANALKMGRTIHADILRRGIASNVFIGCALVSLYRKCGSTVDAGNVFNDMSPQDVALWNAVLVAYTEQGQAEGCLHLYKQMREEGESPDGRTFVSVLQACGLLAEKDPDSVVDGQRTRAKSLEIGKAIHAEAKRKGCDSDVFVGNTTISTYGKCGSLADARFVFDGMTQRNVVSWNAMLITYTQQRQGEHALQLYEQMQEELVSPDAQTFVSVLQGCGICADEENRTSKLSPKLHSLTKGKAIHAEAQRKGYGPNSALGSTLVRMYSKCGSIVDAQCLFDGLPDYDAISWNAMLAAYSEHGEGRKALQLYGHMLEEGTSPNVLTFVTALQACGVLAEKEESVCVDGQSIKVKALQKVRAVFVAAQKETYAADGLVGTTLVKIYGKCGSIRDAENMFHGLSYQDVESWNAMLAAYAEQGEAAKALQMYKQMLEQGISADAETFVSMLQVCGMLAVKEVVADGESFKVRSLEKGKSLHAEAWTRGYHSDVFVVSTIIGMYGRCGAIGDAESVFCGGLYRHSVVVWNVMLAAFVQHGQEGKALDLYRQMQQEGLSPDDITLVCILQACSNTGNLNIARQIHDTVFSTAEHISPFLASALISAFGRCASMVDARRVFGMLPQTDGVSWNALIAGYARQGNCFATLQCYEDMRLEGIAPDKVTFLSLLSACSHAGLVDQGIECFKSMSRDFGVTPEIEHYICMVDLLGRVGNFERVEDVLSTLPVLPNLALWLCLLSACRKHGRIVLGEKAFDGAVHLDPKHAAAYGLMANIYDDAGLVDHAERVRIVRNKECVWKKPGQSWIQHDQEVHTFLAGNCKRLQHMPLTDLLEKVRLETCAVGVGMANRQ